MVPAYTIFYPDPKTLIQQGQLFGKGHLLHFVWYTDLNKDFDVRISFSTRVASF